jgi:hypothetical protein
MKVPGSEQCHWSRAPLRERQNESLKGGEIIAGTSRTFGIRFKLGIIDTAAIMLMFVFITAVYLTIFS